MAIQSVSAQTAGAQNIQATKKTGQDMTVGNTNQISAAARQKKQPAASNTDYKVSISSEAKQKAASIKG